MAMGAVNFLAMTHYNSERLQVEAFWSSNHPSKYRKTEDQESCISSDSASPQQEVASSSMRLKSSVQAPKIPLSTYPTRPIRSASIRNVFRTRSSCLSDQRCLSERWPTYVCALLHHPSSLRLHFHFHPHHLHLHLHPHLRHNHRHL